jgi:hypothetical protein
VATFKLSADPLFVEKIRDIVGLYLNPPTKAMVLCVDEKSQIQALDRPQPALPMMPGVPERRTHETPTVRRWLARHPRFTVHSWLREASAARRSPPTSRCPWENSKPTSVPQRSDRPDSTCSTSS